MFVPRRNTFKNLPKPFLVQVFVRTPSVKSGATCSGNIYKPLTWARNFLCIIAIMMPGKEVPPVMDNSEGSKKAFRIHIPLRSGAGCTILSVALLENNI